MESSAVSSSNSTDSKQKWSNLEIAHYKRDQVYPDSCLMGSNVERKKKKNSFRHYARKNVWSGSKLLFGDKEVPLDHDAQLTILRDLHDNPAGSIFPTAP